MADDAPGPGTSRAYAEGYRQGLSDGRTGGLTVICGDMRDGRTAQRVAGYQAGLAAGKQARVPDRVGRVREPEAGAW